MSDQEAVMAKVRGAFGENEYPGDHFLQGSFEGCEPDDEVGPFQGRSDWQRIGPEFLDAHASALSFFSEAGFRFFLPAYLMADLQGRLKVADPVFHLTHGFSDATVEVPTRTRVFLRTIGKSELLNPRRYGAMTFCDHARYRLSIFTREEAGAIVAYLQYKRDSDPTGFEKELVDAALNSFWLERAQTAPSAESLEQHLTEQEEFVAAIKNNHGEP
jgi:hypothetical protein